MTVTNMDICLNVSMGSATDAATTKASKNKSAFFKPQFKRQLKKKSDEKNDDEKTSNAGKNQRIKQKSLADIVAKNQARFGAIKINKNPQELKPIIKVNKNTKKPSLPTVAQADDKKNELKSTNKPLVSFVNPSTGLKTILAKPKKIDAPKKSLSDIFPSKLNPPSSEKRSEGSKDIKVVQEKKLKNIKSQSSSEKPVKFKKKEKNIETSDEKSEKISHHKSSGKISSLFGNNPDVPTMGQRLVKPVNEPVFSEIKFTDLDIHPFTISNLEQNMGIKKPTIVQQTAIPHILSKRDILIRSQTGSGKTLAYALPIVESLQKIRPKLTRDSGLRALVVVPTRELALQTYECFLKLIKPFTWIVPGYLTGGEKRKAEKARLRRGCSLLVATPGRLLDHIKHTEALKMDAVECFVLDEADRMLDMGYEKDISEIVDALKGITSSKPDNSYDPMKLLRQNTIKQFKDDDEVTEDICEDKKNMIDHEDAGLSEEKSHIAPREYHSGTDSDTESREESAKRKKVKKGVVTVKKISEEKGREGLPSSTRQTILLSATLTGAVEKLAGITLTDPVMVDAAADNLRNTSGNLSEINEDLIVPQGVVQSYVVTPPKLKMVTLSAYIVGKCQTSGNHKILVFMATQDMVDFYTEIMSEILRKSEDEDDEETDPLVDIEFCKLHGSMSQKERTEVFKAFRNAQTGVLFCTDVAARGLDMPKVDCVIQYTGPLSARDYVHRIGRTARAGTSGSAIIFLTPSEIEFIRMLESRRIRIKQEDMNDILNKLMGPLSKHNSVEATATHLQNQFENLVVEDKKFYNAACKGYVSWVRFYASYPKDMRAYYNRKDLHLGHYAKSFALRDPPQRIGGIGKTLRDNNPPIQHSNRLSNQRPERKKQTNSAPNSSQQLQRAGMLKRSRMLNTSEYGDGLEPIKKAKKN